MRKKKYSKCSGFKKHFEASNELYDPFVLLVSILGTLKNESLYLHNYLRECELTCSAGYKICKSKYNSVKFLKICRKISFWFVSVLFSISTLTKIGIRLKYRLKGLCLLVRKDAYCLEKQRYASHCYFEK